MGSTFQAGEIEGVVVRRLESNDDERGWLAEIFREDELDADLMPAMGYVSVTRPGMSRGPHEHESQTDMFCFVGPGTFEIRLWDNREKSPTYGRTQSILAGEERPAVVIIPPGVVHGYRNVGEVDAMAVNLPNRLYRGEGRRQPVDQIRHEDDPQSPFKLA